MCIRDSATLKVYLTASSRVRAGRRYKELTERGESCSLEAIEQDIICLLYTSLSWSNRTATWDSVSDASKYEVKLYRNSSTDVYKRQVGSSSF